MIDSSWVMVGAVLLVNGAGIFLATRRNDKKELKAQGEMAQTIKHHTAAIEKLPCVMNPNYGAPVASLTATVKAMGEQLDRIESKANK